MISIWYNTEYIFTAYTVSHLQITMCNRIPFIITESNIFSRSKMGVQNCITGMQRYVKMFRCPMGMVEEIIIIQKPNMPLYMAVNNTVIQHQWMRTLHLGRGGWRCPSSSPTCSPTTPTSGGTRQTRTSGGRLSGISIMTRDGILVAAVSFAL